MWTARYQSDPQLMTTRYEECHLASVFSDPQELNASWLLSTVLPHFATLPAEHQPMRAARLGGAVTLMSETSQTLPIPLTQSLFDAGMQLTRRKLGRSTFASAWAEGRGMSLDQAIDEALAVAIPSHSEFPRA
jgi:hypothetical protein